MSQANEPHATNPVMIDLAAFVQPSLDSHLMNWRARQAEDDNLTVIPRWMMMFGILYHGGPNGHLTLVAHIPYFNPGVNLSQTDKADSFSYISCVVDRIPVPGILHATKQGKESPYVANFRAAMALLTLKRHAFVMADAWENGGWHRWSQEIIEENTVEIPSSDDDEDLTTDKGELGAASLRDLDDDDDEDDDIDETSISEGSQSKDYSQTGDSEGDNGSITDIIEETSSMEGDDGDMLKREEIVEWSMDLPHFAPVDIIELVS